MSDTLYLTLGMTIVAVTCTYFCDLARREGHRALMWTMALAAGGFFVAAFYFGSQA